MESPREERARWPIERLGLQEDSSDDLSSITTPAERIAMTWFLAETAWKVSGRPLPTYDRSHLPARLFRPGTPLAPDDDA